ncbi:MAG: ATP-binding protein [Bacteroidales bacterium]|nr:ATP-binding protein [Bacteroidales bacterium]MBN2758414.1 ATP-binding protein [Bacteroidales bacterium]
MKEIVVISGKGGTGKTSVTASFAVLAAKNVVVADCDVDAADMHILLKPDYAFSEDFYSGEIAIIDQNACISCNKCKEVCRFNAIPIIDNKYTIDEISCEGCGYCARVCPTNAIKMEEDNVGKWHISETRLGNTLVHAKLGIGAENSGKLVAKVKNEAKRLAKETEKDFILIDGSPGIGCPVVSSLSGANFVVLVTEPTVSGKHDLERVYKLVKKFNIKAGCIINKYDLNTDVTDSIEKFLQDENIIHLANLPYNENFTKAMIEGKTIVEFENSEIKQILENSWNLIKNI